MSPYVLQQLLTISADKHPDQCALVDGERVMTYRELEVASSQLANTLLHAGVQRGDRVGIYLEKSIEAVVSIFAVLKAGAAYVPFDIHAPVSRVATMAQDCRANVLISTYRAMAAWENDLLDTLVSLETIIVTDTEVKRVEWSTNTIYLVTGNQVGRGPIQNSIEGDDLAYILYTSGSTGTPKGVMISHRASLSFIDWAYTTFQVSSRDRVSSHAPFHFDLSIFDLFVTIKAGATVILLTKGASMFPLSLAQLIAKEEITIWYSVPWILTKLVLYGRLEKHDFSHLRTILFAGEVFPIKHLKGLMQKIPDATYYNLYGPTETNVCHFYKVPALDPNRIDALPIGRVCAHCEAIVLGDDNQQLDDGEIGELCVSGPSLMTGYWGAPELTDDARPLLALHSDRAPQLVYHTGDFVKKEPNGNYLYLGRRDGMIKSRGYRIELGEIENILYRHPLVRQAALITIPDNESSNIIIAFISLDEDRVHGSSAVKPVTARDLKSFCAQHLPRYMIPSKFEFRSELPHTSTGKIDKHKLQQEARTQ